MNILIVEDDPGIAANLLDYLVARGHPADWAANAAQALDRLQQQSFDALVLDVGLPRVDGLRLLKMLREDWQYTLPVLLLTARDSEADVLAGFAAGADDYVVKPFSLAEVEARLQALVRRLAPRAETSLRLGDVLELDLVRCELRVGGELRQAPPKALKLVETLLRQPGRVFSRGELEQALWGEPQEHSDNLRQVLYQARKVLRLPDGDSPLQTVHGMGYRLKEMA